MEDVQPIQLAMTGERNNTITGIIKSFRRQLLGFIKLRVKNTQDAEDILQDVFYQLAGNDEPIEQVSNWLYTVARNKITDNYRKHKLPLADDVLNYQQTDDGLFEWKEFLLADDKTPETEYLRSLFWEELQAALDELPAEQREAFVQNEIEGIAFKDMQEQSGIPVATLISRKRYAVLHLRERLSVLKNELLNY